MSEKALALMPVSEIREMATAVVRSRLFPDVKDEAAAFALMMLCQSEGIHPMQAVRRYHLIQGRPAMKADAMLAEFQRRGGKVKWVSCDHEKCEAVFTSPGLDGAVTVKWTIEDGKRAGLLRNPTWNQYPRQMLRSRVISEGIRMAMPEVVVGIYTEEETRDFVPGGHSTEYTPPAEPTPAPKALEGTQASSPSAPPVESGDEEAASSTRSGGERLTTGEVVDAEPDWDPAKEDLVECFRLVEEGHRKNGTYKCEFVPAGKRQRRSLEQNKKLQAMRHDLGLTDADWRKGLTQYYSKESSKDLSVDEADDLIAKLQHRWNQRKYKNPADKAVAKERRLEEANQEMRGHMERVREPGSDDE